MQNRKYAHLVLLQPIRDNKGCAANNQLPCSCDTPFPPRIGVARKDADGIPDVIDHFHGRRLIIGRNVGVRSRELLRGWRAPPDIHLLGLLRPPHFADHFLDICMRNQLSFFRGAQPFFDQLDVILVQLQIAFDRFI